MLFFSTVFLTDCCSTIYHYYFLSQGCFLNNMECYDKPKCVEKRPESKKNLNFCCCEGDMCNKDFAWEPALLPPPINSKFCFGAALLNGVFFNVEWYLLDKTGCD